MRIVIRAAVALSARAPLLVTGFALTNAAESTASEIAFVVALFSVASLAYSRWGSCCVRRPSRRSHEATFGARIGHGWRGHPSLLCLLRVDSNELAPKIRSRVGGQIPLARAAQLGAPGRRARAPPPGTGSSGHLGKDARGGHGSRSGPGPHGESRRRLGVQAATLPLHAQMLRVCPVEADGITLRLRRSRHDSFLVAIIALAAGGLFVVMLAITHVERDDSARPRVPSAPPPQPQPPHAEGQCAAGAERSSTSTSAHLSEGQCAAGAEQCAISEGDPVVGYLVAHI